MDRYGVRDLNAPWYAGLPTFARAPFVAPDAVPDGDVAVVGIPVDEFATSSQRQGMRWGPRRVREASRRWARTNASIAGDLSLDVASGRVTRWPERAPIVDTGDTPVVHSDVPAQVRAIGVSLSADQGFARNPARESFGEPYGVDHRRNLPAMGEIALAEEPLREPRVSDVMRVVEARPLDVHRR